MIIIIIRGLDSTAATTLLQSASKVQFFLLGVGFYAGTYGLLHGLVVGCLPPELLQPSKWRKLNPFLSERKEAFMRKLLNSPCLRDKGAMLVFGRYLRVGVSCSLWNPCNSLGLGTRHLTCLFFLCMYFLFFLFLQLFQPLVLFVTTPSKIPDIAARVVVGLLSPSLGFPQSLCFWFLAPSLVCSVSPSL